jgi:hypothetical protein
MLEKAMEIYQRDGETALEEWFNALSDTDRQLFKTELVEAVSVMQDALAGFSQSIYSSFAPVIKALSDFAEGLTIKKGSS